MAPKVLISTVAAACALVACAQQPAAPGGPSGRWINCDTSNGSTANPKVCVVTVRATITNGVCRPDDIIVDPPELQLVALKPARIVWRLENSFRFCPLQGDGAFLKEFDETNQFSDPQATDQEDGTGDPATIQNACRRNFRIHNANNASGSLRIYEYGLRFHSRDGRISCVKDPFIKNGQ